MSIKAQKLELYKRYLMQSDRGHFVIRGLKGEELTQELDRMWNDHYNKITEVPKKYTLNTLKVLLG